MFRTLRTRWNNFWIESNAIHSHTSYVRVAYVDWMKLPFSLSYLSTTSNQQLQNKPRVCLCARVCTTGPSMSQRSRPAQATTRGEAKKKGKILFFLLKLKIRWLNWIFKLFESHRYLLLSLDKIVILSLINVNNTLPHKFSNNFILHPKIYELTRYPPLFFFFFFWELNLCWFCAT